MVGGGYKSGERELNRVFVGGLENRRQLQLSLTFFPSIRCIHMRPTCKCGWCGGFIAKLGENLTPG
jgi:hypothetical protein